MRVLVAALFLLPVVAFAETPAPKDRAAFVVDAITSQRDRAQADAAACYADANVMIAKLQVEIAELKASKKDKPDGN